MKKIVIAFVLVILVATVSVALLTRTETAKNKQNGNDTVITYPHEVLLRVGETKNIGDLVLTLESVPEDSRCPINAKCIWAGRVAISLIAREAGLAKTLVLKTDDAPVSFAGVLLSIANVAPLKEMGAISSGQYVITIKVDKEKVGSIDTTGKTGIVGTVKIGPTCPVERIPPDPNCAYKPYAANLVIKTAKGDTVKTVSAGTDGAFSVLLPPGRYIIENAGTRSMPTLAPVVVVVNTGSLTRIDLIFDSGIR